jgi:hypothetical protein
MIVTIEYNDDWELVLPLGEEIMQGLDWKLGDNISWTDNGDGSWTLSKVASCELAFDSEAALEKPRG